MSIREKFRKKKAKFLADGTCMVLNAKAQMAESAKLNAGSVAMVGASGMAAASLMTTAADLQKTIGDQLLKPIYKIFIGLSTGLAVVCIGYHLLCLFGGNAKKTEMHIDAIKRIVVVWCILNMLGALFNFVAPLVQGNGLTDSSPALTVFRKISR